MLRPCLSMRDRIKQFCDNFYAPLGHGHDSDYALPDHNHDSDYAPLDHNHDSDYAPLGHNHDDRYYTESEIDVMLAGLGGSVGGFWNAVYHQVATTNPGTLTAGVYTKRNLNTVIYQETGYYISDGGVQVPGPGFYWVEAWAQGYRVSRHHVALQNGSDSHRGEGAYATSGYYGCNQSKVEAIIAATGTVPQVWYLRHKCDSTLANEGQGRSAYGGSQVYASFKIRYLFDIP